jgi:uncharacterized protein with NRDE domain
MCLIALAFGVTPAYPLVVAANRDEWRARPSAAAGWWDDAPEILAGRDLAAGGTWLGVARSGRFAALTNVRDPSDQKPGAPSRGELVKGYLSSNLAPLEFLQQLASRAAQYTGFNLIVGDAQTLYCFGSRSPGILPVAPGVHGVSNHRLDEPWPKVDKAKSLMGAAFEQELSGKALQSSCFAILSNAERPPDAALPDTGVGLEWERRLSPILITGPDYGTRTSTVVMMGRDGLVDFEERTLDPSGRVQQVAAFRFRAAP